MGKGMNQQIAHIGSRDFIDKLRIALIEPSFVRFFDLDMLLFDCGLLFPCLQRRLYLLLLKPVKHPLQHE
jgi:hypothetical protein